MGGFLIRARARAVRCFCPPERRTPRSPRSVSNRSVNSWMLGCAGMTDLMAEMSARFGIPLIDGVTSAAAFAEALAAIGARTSKIGGYAAPLR